MYLDKSIQIVIGSILGDGSLRKLTKTKQTSSLIVSQHSSRLPYLEWLHKHMGKKFDLSPIKPKNGYTKGHEQYYFESRQSRILGYFRKKFYPNGKKIIPPDISDFLKYPISLAVWYMDDGTLDNRSKYHFNSSIATYNFSFKDCLVLSDVLKQNFGLSVSVNQSTMRGKTYARLYIRAESMNKFIALVKPFINKVFDYKIV